MTHLDSNNNNFISDIFFQLSLFWIVGRYLDHDICSVSNKSVFLPIHHSFKKIGQMCVLNKRLCVCSLSTYKRHVTHTCYIVVHIMDTLCTTSQFPNIPVNN